MRRFVYRLWTTEQLHVKLTFTFPGKIHGVVTNCCKLGKSFVVLLSVSVWKKAVGKYFKDTTGFNTKNAGEGAKGCCLFFLGGIGGGIRTGGCVIEVLGIPSSNSDSELSCRQKIHELHEHSSLLKFLVTP